MPRDRRKSACDVAQRVAEALRDWRGQIKSAPKHIAREIGAKPDTVDAWMTGANAPQAHYLIALCRESDEVFAAVCELAGRKPPRALTDREKARVREALKILEGE